MNKSFFLFFTIILAHVGSSQELTGEWSGSDANWSTSLCDVVISTSVSEVGDGAAVNISNGVMKCNMLNTFASNSVVGNPALQVLFKDNESNTQSGIITFSFSKPIKDPILHIDQLGEWDYLTLFKAISISVKLTIVSEDLSMTKLSGNGDHFKVTPTELYRTIERTSGKEQTDQAISECGIPISGSAAGSVQIRGIVVEVSFLFEINATDQLDQDSILLAWEGSCENDVDGDGLNDNLDLDDDNDGILDELELKGDPLRDTDSDGLIDSIDLDSDNDGCYDVKEAGFSDNDENGTLGVAPDRVDSNGLIIGVSDGYTEPLDDNLNNLYDFQEEVLRSMNSHPKDLIAKGGDNVTFSILGSNLSSMKWQVSDDKGLSWLDLKNNSVYSGVYTENLTISNVSLSYNDNMYRLIDEFCSSIIYSNPVILNVFLNYPKFFTPNDDGHNDLWTIKGVENTSYNISIYDRYGKLLKMLTNTSSGWDGTYKNQDLPESDYWFKYKDGLGRSLIGHFTLKRY